MNSHFGNTRTNCFAIAKASQLQAINTKLNPGAGTHVFKICEPMRELIGLSDFVFVFHRIQSVKALSGCKSARSFLRNPG